MAFKKDINFNLEGLEEKDKREIKYLLQEINDTLEGGLTSRNLSSFLNVYVINEKDSLDASYPMYVHFNIINEMIKIVSVKVSFWILNYRAYSTAAKSGGAVTSASGGGETPTTSSGGSSTPTSESGGNVTSASGGGETPTSSSGGSSTPTTSSGGGQTTSNLVGTLGYYPVEFNAENLVHYNASADNALITIDTVGILADHNHTVSNHTHTVTIAAHTHTVTIAAHTHTGGLHTHDITYGIHEEANSPTIKFYISDTGEDNYSNTFFGGYTADKANINITDYITTVGSKMIKFTSTTRTRLSVQIELKLATTAR